MNYIIAGTSRCGKTMLVNMLVRNLKGFSKISIDNIKCAFEETVPSLNINFEDGVGNTKILPDFFESFFRGAMYKDIEDGLSYVAEGDGLPFEKLLSLNQDENIKVIFLGKPSISEKEYFEEIRFFEGKYLFSEWTKALSDEELLENCRVWITRSKEYKRLCKKHGIDFFDTSFCQREVVEKIFNMIKSENV